MSVHKGQLQTPFLEQRGRAAPSRTRPRPEGGQEATAKPNTAP